MTANPSITLPNAGPNATANRDVDNKIRVACLYSNSVEGVVTFSGTYYTTSCQAYAISTPTATCAKVTTDPFKLLGYTPLIVGIPSTETKACIGIFTCTTDESCITPSCTTFNTTPSAEAYNIPIIGYNSSGSITPQNLVATPGDGQLEVSWDITPDPLGGGLEVFAYRVIVTGGPQDIDGYVNIAENPFTLTGLTNGTEYTIRVWALSHGLVQSEGYAEVKAIPNITKSQRINIAQGFGTINVYRDSDNHLLGTITTGYQDFTFTIDTIFRTESTPASEYIFEKYCVCDFSDTECPLDYCTTTAIQRYRVVGNGRLDTYFTQTSHLECVSGTCTSVSGPGTDECSTEGNTAECHHKKCSSGSCIDDPTPGTDECTENPDCTPTTMWKCSGTPNYTCTQDPSGTYTSQALCEASCTSTGCTKFSINLTISQKSQVLFSNNKKTLTSEQIRDIPISELIELYKQGFNLTEYQLYHLAKTCLETVKKGSIIDIKLDVDTINTGVSPYIYYLLINDNLVETFPSQSGQTTTETTHTFSIIFDKLGTFKITVKADDSCSLGQIPGEGIQSIFEECTINVTETGTTESKKSNKVLYIAGGVIILGAGYILLSKQKSEPKSKSKSK